MEPEITMKNHLNTCPKCENRLKITRYTCENCGIRIEGDFAGCAFCRLSDEDRLFALIFLQTEGNMKDVERVMGISYPTIKSRLAQINRELSGSGGVMKIARRKRVTGESTISDSGIDKTRILDRLGSGEIDPATASRLLRGEPEESETTENTSDNTDE
jgi:hypothetical protein